MATVIFLDTNIFENAKFSYNSKHMQDFLKRCEEDEIELKITDVVENEVQKRIRANIEDPLKGIKKAVFDIAFASLDISRGKHGFIETLITKLTEDFYTFINTNDVEIIESDYEIKELTSLYFLKKAPFTEQKKDEFPDAIILLTIDKYSNKNPSKTILTVSKDKSFSEYHADSEVKNFAQISEITSYLIENPDLPLTRLFEVSKNKIKEEIITYIKNNDRFVLFSYDSIHDVEVTEEVISNVVLKNLNITSYEEYASGYEIRLHADLLISFTLSATYADPDSIIYDREDNKDYSSLCTSVVEFDASISCDIALTIDNDEFDIEEIEYSENEFEFYLDDDSIVDTSYEYDEDF
ncbi:MAG: DUF4935 domain-containing protein [Campylobacteraceae bacterium]|nr:DUF4935 domain-containing protein [Campylobacteraceae bacterium]